MLHNSMLRDDLLSHLRQGREELLHVPEALDCSVELQLLQLSATCEAIQ